MPDLPTFPPDHLALFGQPDAPALAVRDKVYSFKELNLRIGRLAAWLATRGLSAGDRVATWLGKSEVACLMPLASVRAGLVHVPVNPLLKAAQVAHIIADSGAQLLVTNAARAATLDATSLPVSLSQFLADERAVQAILDDAASPILPPLPEDTDPDTLAAILYTSGSTGRPKGVVLSHANLALGADSVAQYLKLSSDDITLAVLPLSFDYGQNQLLSTWRAGGCVVPLDYLTARDVIKACAKHSITTLAAVPPLWVQLVEQDWPTDATRNMRRLTNSGGALTPSLVKMLRSIFGHKTDIFAMYGLTEAFRSTFLDPALIDDKPTSMGHAIPYAEIMVVTPEGIEAGPDQAGELVHAGPLVAKGYWQDNARTAERFKPAPAFSTYGGMAVWSGDTVRRDRDGLLYFVGRDDAMIKTSGNRVSPTEIEEAAVESGLVAEACALGRKDDRLGAVIVLFVRGDGNDDGLKVHLKATLPNFMQPAEVVWLDTFPKNANGKLDRTVLVQTI
ncbi:acyl-CoA ligase (AMP-forming), exosortase A system-associated [Sphingorhabdus sp.]|uniref:acyl-CoA ligase (AMP-forming), exosortase A system-associated n=1 Tax=Sphingorhabdus sp. TaxID=1902408 RepID=UPI0035937A7C